MAKFKLPSIKTEVAAEVKPMNTMVKSITSKLKGNAIKAPKVKGMTKAPKVEMAKPMKMPSMKMPSFVMGK